MRYRSFGSLVPLLLFNHNIRILDFKKSAQLNILGFRYSPVVDTAQQIFLAASDNPQTFADRRVALFADVFFDKTIEALYLIVENYQTLASAYKTMFADNDIVVEHSDSFLKIADDILRQIIFVKVSQTLSEFYVWFDGDLIVDYPEDYQHYY